MENFLYAMKNVKEIKFVDIDFDLFRYSMDSVAGDLLITYDALLGIVYYYLAGDSSKKYDPSWKNVKVEKVVDYIMKRENVCKDERLLSMVWVLLSEGREYTCL